MRVLRLNSQLPSADNAGMARTRAKSSLRRRGRCALTVIGAALLVAAWVAPASAEITEVAITPASAPAGTNVTISGGSCRKNGPDPSSVHVVAPSLGIDMTLAPSPNGAWSGELFIPAGAPAGAHPVTVTCLRGQVVLSYPPVTFTVDPTAAAPTSTTPSVTTAAPTPTEETPIPPATSLARGGAQPDGPTDSLIPRPPDAAVSPPTRLAPGATSALPTPGDRGNDGVTASDAAPATTGQGARVPATGPEIRLAAPSSPERSPALVVIGVLVAVAASVWVAWRRTRGARRPIVVGPPVIKSIAASVVPDVRALPAAEPAPLEQVALPAPVRSADDLVAVDVARSVRELEPLIRATVGPNVAVQVDVQPDGCITYAGRGDLDAVILALVGNAIVATAGGGMIRVAAGRGPGAGMAADDRHWALAIVADTGPGIPPDVLIDLFDESPTELESSEPQSGLWAVRRIVSSLGGHLDISSVAGHGTMVTVALPLEDDDIAAPVLSQRGGDR